ncbi:hypothetical protein O9H85_28880 [Paenibacillus filicis]|uniref:Uncharacterized protein n=1 Tax=Paenibacillus gyeongsangnamensis TaxID=3388067 RepID=A0ABT4QHY0_9BACL|nr:hypothetical protein [Paenibacillus filicis]MCZ8516336.1 hypothetical protein [Paenibacillus filicis]
MDMRMWTAAEPAGEIRVHQDDEQGYQCSMKVHAWEGNQQVAKAEGKVVAVVYGVINSGNAEIRVQYEQKDYAAHKTNLVVQRAVKQAIKRIQDHVIPYLNGH